MVKPTWVLLCEKGWQPAELPADSDSYTVGPKTLFNRELGIYGVPVDEAEKIQSKIEKQAEPAEDGTSCV